ncbi:MAG TPA: hypothetical protein PLN69_06190 [bacterium]|nr:hypothetical protein [bacterium]
MKKLLYKACLSVPLILTVLFLTFCFAGYVGHEDDRDIEAFLSEYPEMKGTSLDGCNLCHRGGEVTMPARKNKPERRQYVNSCDYCHVIYMNGDSDIKETLNKFGMDYNRAGRNRAAFAKIASADSDGDGFTNERELKELTQPGSESSSPGVPPAPAKVFSKSDLMHSVPVVKQTVFSNSHKSPEGDTYYTYRGFELIEILNAAGLAAGAETVDVISVDGYRKTFTIDWLSKQYEQGAPVFGFSKKDLNECGWAHYDGEGLEEFRQLEPVKPILAFEINGDNMGMSSLDPKNGKLVGLGPFRTIFPQTRISPPDQNEFAPEHCHALPAVYQYHPEYEHNADYNIKAVVAIRVNPIPEGTRDFDWQQGGWEYLTNEKIIIYGAIEE